MSTVDNELQRLGIMAVNISQIPNKEERHKAGWNLNSELVSLYDNHLFTQNQRLDFMAVVRIMFDHIFHDAIVESAGIAKAPL